MRLLIVIGMWVGGAAAAQMSVTESAIDVGSAVRFVSFAADSRSVIAAGPFGVQAWDLETGDRIPIETGHLNELDSFPVGSASVVLRTDDLSTGEVLYEPPQGVGVVRAAPAAVSRDGRLFALSVADSRRLGVWDTNTGGLLFSADSGLGAAMDLEFSPDGSLLAATYQDTNIYVWSVPDGRLLHVIDDQDLSSFTLEFSSDGSELMTAGADQLLRVWDARTWTPIRQFETVHPEAIRDLQFSTDGRFLLTSGIDVTSQMNPAHLVLWDTVSGSELARIRLSRSPESVALAPDGKSIAVVEADDAKIRLWTVGH